MRKKIEPYYRKIGKKRVKVRGHYRNYSSLFSKKKKGYILIPGYSGKPAEMTEEEKKEFEIEKYGNWTNLGVPISEALSEEIEKTEYRLRTAKTLSEFNKQQDKLDLLKERERELWK